MPTIKLNFNSDLIFSIKNKYIKIIGKYMRLNGFKIIANETHKDVCKTFFLSLKLSSKIEKPYIPIEKANKST